MRNLAIMVLALAGFAQAGCSERTKESAGQTVEAAKADAREAAEKAGISVDSVTEKATTAVERAGDKAADVADKARQRIHEETAPSPTPASK